MASRGRFHRAGYRRRNLRPRYATARRTGRLRKSIASTAIRCGARWRRWLNADWCARNAAAELMSRLPRIAYPLRSRTRFSEIVGAGGLEASGQLLSASVEPATRDLAKRLGLKTDAPLLRIDALRMANRIPICLGTTWARRQSLRRRRTRLREDPLDDQTARTFRRTRLSPRMDQRFSLYRRRRRRNAGSISPLAAPC